MVKSSQYSVLEADLQAMLSVDLITNWVIKQNKVVFFEANNTKLFEKPMGHKTKFGWYIRNILILVKI
jgi:hypothetical protein